MRPESTEDFIDDKELVEKNLEGISGMPKVLESDEALLHQSDTSNLSAHNYQYTELLKAYVLEFKKNSSYKRKNKQELFKIAKRLLFWTPVVTIIFLFTSLYCLATGKVDVLESLPGLFTALATLLGTFMIVPKIITKYLYNKKEDDHLADIISKIQEYDRNIRDGL